MPVRTEACACPARCGLASTLTAPFVRPRARADVQSSPRFRNFEKNCRLLEDLALTRRSSQLWAAAAAVTGALHAWSIAVQSQLWPWCASTTSALCMATRHCQNGGDQAGLLSIYYDQPLDGYTVNIEHVQQCAVLEHLTHRQTVTAHRATSDVGNIRFANPLFLAAHPIGHIHLLCAHGDHNVCLREQLDAVSTQNANEVLRTWGIESDASNVPVLLVPYPIAVLICSGHWHTLLLLTRWHIQLNCRQDQRRIANGELAGPIPDWPPHDSQAWMQQGQNGCVPAVAPMSASSLASIAKELRRWAPTILAAEGPETVIGERLVLEECIECLQSWSLSFSEAAGCMDINNGNISRFRHDSKKLLQCIRFSRLLRGGPEQLLEALDRAMALCMPTAMVGTFMQSRQGSRSQMPSPSTIRRNEIAP